MANDISKTAIINLALANLGQKLVHDDAEETNTARTARLMYDFVRRNLLRAHDWAFALRWADLAARDVETPDLKLPYVFALPADCILLRKFLTKTCPLATKSPIPSFMTTRAINWWRAPTAVRGSAMWRMWKYGRI